MFSFVVLLFSLFTLDELKMLPGSHMTNKQMTSHDNSSIALIELTHHCKQPTIIIIRKLH